jgi:pimeloyl-ACP methyl ester carboxylesterase
MTTHQTAKTQYIPYKDGKIAYRRFGASTGVPLVFFIHFRGTMDKWDPLLVNTLAKTRPVILIDYVGVGQSVGKVATSFKDSADDMIAALIQIGVKEVDVIGFSIGGFVTEMVALNSPKDKLKVRKIVLCGTGASAGPGIELSSNDYMPAATAEKIDLVNFKELFFAHNPAGEKHAEEWWARLAERNESTSGEKPSQWLSWGFTDGGEGLKNQGISIEKFLTAETSQQIEGSYGRLPSLDIPVLIANGSVSRGPTPTAALQLERADTSRMII